MADPSAIPTAPQPRALAAGPSILRYVCVYYAIACGVSWIVWTPLVLGQDDFRLLHISPPLPVMVSIGTLGPLFACYIAHRLQTGNWRAVRFLPRHRLRLLWLLLGPMLVVFCLFAVFPALISTGSPTTWHWHPGILAGILLPMFNYNLLGGPLFEEFGWRGFLQTRLQDFLPPWIAAVCVGAMWAAWHVPLFLVHGWSSASFPIYLAIMIGLSTVMAFGFNSAEGAVPVAILMHSAFNASPRFLDGYLRDVSTRAFPSPVLLIAAAFLLVGATLVGLTRGRLAASRVEPSSHRQL